MHSRISIFILSIGELQLPHPAPPLPHALLHSTVIPLLFNVRRTSYVVYRTEAGTPGLLYDVVHNLSSHRQAGRAFTRVNTYCREL